MDDITLISIGRQFLEFCVQREQFMRIGQNLETKVAELEKKIKSIEAGKVDGDKG